MQWYVSRNGETVGPVPEAQVIEWTKQGMPGAYVCDESSSAWVPLDRSPFAAYMGKAAPAPTALKKSADNTAKGCAIAFFVLLVGSYAAVRLMAGTGDESEAEATASPTTGVAEKAKPAPRTTSDKLECRIRSKELGNSDVGLFPTEAGLDEYVKASVSGDSQAAMIAIRANRAFFVEADTKCLRLDTKLFSGTAKVRVTEGPHAGRIGWAPTEWTMKK